MSPREEKKKNKIIRVVVVCVWWVNGVTYMKDTERGALLCVRKRERTAVICVDLFKKQSALCCGLLTYKGVVDVEIFDYNGSRIPGGSDERNLAFTHCINVRTGCCNDGVAYSFLPTVRSNFPEKPFSYGGICSPRYCILLVCAC